MSAVSGDVGGDQRPSAIVERLLAHVASKQRTSTARVVSQEQQQLTPPHSEVTDERLDLQAVAHWMVATQRREARVLEHDLRAALRRREANVDVRDLAW